MTGACPSDGVLEQLLADHMGGAQKQALELHVAGCAACRRRLEQLNRGGMTLPAWLADTAKEGYTKFKNSDIIIYNCNRTGRRVHR